jgi:hypothetical protein
MGRPSLSDPRYYFNRHNMLIWARATTIRRRRTFIPI